MTSAIATALLSSLALFVGLSTLARRRLLPARLHFSAGAALLLGVLGVGLMVVWSEYRAAVMALLIGLLGYVFGYATTPKRTLPSAAKPK